MNPPRVRRLLTPSLFSLTMGTLTMGCSQRTISADGPSNEPVSDAAVAPPAFVQLVQHEAPGLDSAPEPVPDAISCPSDMVLVEGRYCPDVRQTCLEWTDPPGTYELFRCARYGKPVCASSQTTLRAMQFCIDRDEYTEPGTTVPAVHHSWTSAKQTCESLGRRLCLESEWQFACEGEEMRPYPYGFVRDARACNIDRTNLGKPNAGLRDLREPAGSHPACVSPFGVRDMSGNVEEWASLDKPGLSHDGKPDRSTMKGAWWLPGRNHCRAATTGHGETYEGGQVGVRCCKDAG